MAHGLTLLILAGGRSRRMGRDKAMLKAGETTLVEHLAHRLRAAVDETLVAGGTVRDRWPGLRQLEDPSSGLGPLAGMQVGFLAARQPLVWVVACDLPDVLPQLGDFLATRAEGFDAVIPWIGSEPQPLCAVYRPRLAKTIEHLLRQGQRSVKRLLSEIAVHNVGENELRSIDASLDSFSNLNTYRDYEAWLKKQR